MSSGSEHHVHDDSQYGCFAECASCFYVKRKLHKMYPASIDALKTVNSEEYSRAQYGSSVTCYGILPSQFQDCCEWHHGHIQNVILKYVMINMNSYRHGMYLSLLTEFVHFSLKCYFI